MSEYAVAIILLALIPVLTIAILLMLASMGWWFMRPVQGTTTFFVKGNTLQKIVPNVEHYRLSEKVDFDGYRWLVPEHDPKKIAESLFADSLWVTAWLQKWLWNMFGIRFISLFWPAIDVHSFDLQKVGHRRLIPRNDLPEGAPLSARVVGPSPRQTTVVDNLLFVVPRPVYVEGIDLAGDNSKINLLLLVMFQQVVPSIPVFNLRGDFFSALDAAVEAVLVDLFARHQVAVFKQDQPRAGQFAGDSYDPANAGHEPSHLTYELWLHMSKAGKGLPITEAYRRLNVTQEYFEKLKRLYETYGETAETTDVWKHAQQIVGEGARAIQSDEKSHGIIPLGIVPKFGFAATSVTIVDWEPHSSTKPIAEALLAKETQRHLAEGVREKASGDRDAKLADAVGSSARIAQVMESLIAKGVAPDVAAQTVETWLRTENIGKMPNLSTYVEGDRGANKEGKRTSLLITPTSPSSTRKEGA